MVGDRYLQREVGHIFEGWIEHVTQMLPGFILRPLICTGVQIRRTIISRFSTHASARAYACTVPRCFTFSLQLTRSVLYFVSCALELSVNSIRSEIVRLSVSKKVTFISFKIYIALFYLFKESVCENKFYDIE